MIYAIILALILALFPSCTPDSSLETREIHVITVADDFYNHRKTLKNVINDQAALVGEFLTFGDNVHIHAYTAQEGKRYYSTHPNYTAVNKEGAEVDRSSTEFDHFQYVPTSAESISGWTMDDVLAEIGALNTTSGDLVIFTYSGHGDEKQGALLTNYRGGNSWDSTNKEAVIEALNSINGYKVLFLDSCYSGSFITDGTITTTDTFTTDEDRYNGEDYIEAFKKSSLEKTADSSPDMWIMSASGRNQESLDYLTDRDSIFQEHFGAFTYYILKALGYDMDLNEARKETTILTFYSIYDYVRANFPSSTIDAQTPRVKLRRLDVRLR